MTHSLKTNVKVVGGNEVTTEMASSSIALNYSLAQQTNNLLENGFSSHHKEQMLLISALDLLI